MSRAWPGPLATAIVVAASGVGLVLAFGERNPRAIGVAAAALFALCFLVCVGAAVADAVGWRRTIARLRRAHPR